MKIMAIAGVGDGTGVSPKAAAVGWTIIGCTVLAVFLGTLMLKPKKGE